MPVVNHSEINWNLAKLDWDMVLRAQAAKTAAGAQMASANTYANASMQNAQTQAQSAQQIASGQQGVEMRGQDVQNKLGLLENQAKLRGQDIEAQNALMQNYATLRGQDLQNQWENQRTGALFGARMGKLGADPYVAMQQMQAAGGPVPNGLNDLPQDQKDLVNHQITAQVAHGVLFGQNPQQSWQTLYGAMQANGQNPEKMGLSPTLNAPAMMYAGQQLQNSTGAINNIINPKTQQADQQAGFKSDIDAWNKQKAMYQPVINALSDIPNMQNAVQIAGQYGLGTGPLVGDLYSKRLAQAGDMLGNQGASQAAGAFADIDRYGAQLKILQRPQNAKAFSPTENTLLQNLSISPSNTVSENLANIQGFKNLATKYQGLSNLGDNYIKATGSAEGINQVAQQYLKDISAADDKGRPQPVDPDAWKKYVPQVTQQFQPGQGTADQGAAQVVQQPQGNPGAVGPQGNIYM